MMMRGLTRAALRRHRLVLAGAFVAVPVLALAGGPVRHSLSVGGFVAPQAESTRAFAHLDEVFATAAPNQVIVATATQGDVLDGTNTAAGLQLVGALGTADGVIDVVSPWTIGELPDDVANPLVSHEGDKAVIALRLAGDEDDQRATVEELGQLYDDQGETFTLTPTGAAEVSREAAEQAEADLLRAELIAAPLTLVGLLLVFRGWRAAAIPLVVALLTVLATFTVLRALASLTTVSVFALNLTTALGLGLSIDYSLLLVARFREERGAGRSVEAAVARAVGTAGRTVVFSALTVSLSLLALLVFPFPYLRSFAYAGIAVVAVAAAVTVVVVPALLVRYGHRLGHERPPTGIGFWTAQAQRVTRHPWPWALAVTALLLAAGLPFRTLAPGRIDDRVLPAGADARRGADALRSDFYLVNFTPISVITPWISPTDDEAVSAMEVVLLSLPGVHRVDSVHGFSGTGLSIPPTAYSERFRAGPGDGTWFNVISWHEPDSSEARQLVERIRHLDSRIEVTGTTAVVVDSVDAVARRAPLAIGIVAVTTLLVLFAMTGSLLLPLKALALNMLSLTATFGALVWVFQQGHLAGPLGITTTGQLDVFTPILMFCVAFGLSMDYEVFILARIQEARDLTGDDKQAVVCGLARSGRLVTAAAVLMAIVFLSIATSGVAIVKLFGLGLALAVLIDAFLIRATLMPAFIRLAGRANWWAPGPLRRAHLRYGLWETEPVELPSRSTPDTELDTA